MQKSQDDRIVVHEDHAVITAENGTEILIDIEDIPVARRFTWWIEKRTGYPITRVYRNGYKTNIKMHRLLMQEPKGLSVDHKNHNPSDNRRSNLRLASHTQNLANQRKHRDNKSGFKGVYLDRSKWRAYIGHQKRAYHLGSFDTPEAASEAYDNKARELFGEYALTNEQDRLIG